MSDEPPAIQLRYCQFCQRPIVYEDFPPGAMWLHDLGGGDLEFLCPDLTVE